MELAGRTALVTGASSGIGAAVAEGLAARGMVVGFCDDIEPLPASAVVDVLVAQLETGQFEAYLPEWFADVASGKAANLQGYLAGAAEYWHIKRAEDGHGAVET